MKKDLILSVAVMMAGSMAAQTDGLSVNFVREAPAFSGTRMETTEVIKEVPEGGRVVNYARDAGYFYVSLNSVYFGQDTAYAAEIVYFDEEGVAYIKNPMSGLTTNTYIKGEYKDNKIVCTFPQTLYVQNIEGREYIYNVNLLRYTEVMGEDGDQIGVDYVFDPDVPNQMTWNIDEETGRVYQESDQLALDGYLPEYAMALTYNSPEDGEVWYPYGDVNQIYYKFTDEPTKLPEGAVTEDWQCNYWLEENKWTRDTTVFKVYINGDKMYIGNLYKDGQKGNYIVGTIKGDQVVFKSGQYIGLNIDTNHYSYFMGAYAEFVDVPGQDYKTAKLVDLKEIALDYDAEARELSSDQILVINNGYLEMNFIYMYVEPYMHYVDMSNPAAPQAPFDVWAMSWDDPTMKVRKVLMFRLPKVDMNGNPLDTDRMYYNIWADDEPCSLYPEDYPGVTSEMFDIPYNFDNNDNVIYNGNLHQLCFYFVNEVQKYRIQQFYVKPDGDVLASAVTVYNTDGSDRVDETQAEITGESYFDLTGRKVQNPGKGIWIKVENLSDGSVRSSKVLRAE